MGEQVFWLTLGMRRGGGGGVSVLDHIGYEEGSGMVMVLTCS